MKTIIKNATLLPETGYDSGNWHVTIENKRIASITRELPDLTRADVVDAKGNLLIPGFYNAHCHAAMTLFRGYGEDLPLQRWLEERIFPAEDRLNYENVTVATRLAIAEMLKGGIVSFSDMYMFEDAVAEVVLETGMKANLSRALVSFSPDANIATDSRFAEAKRLVEQYQDADDGRVKVDFSLHAEYTNLPHYIAQVGEYTAANYLRMHLHVSETEKEHNECIARHKKTPTQLFYDLGALDTPTLAAHCVWVSDEDIAILAEKGVSVVHNPVSNLKLGSGVMPLGKLLKAGVNVCFGTDGVASNNRLDILREMQTAAILHKGILLDPTATTASQMPRLATRNGALAQGREDCGEIRIGARADLVLIDRTSLHNMPCFDDYAMLCYSAERSDVLLTMVDGRILYQNGTYTLIDEERLRFDAQKTFAHYFD
ncbi:MAG: amidohydrolase [Ruminococcaceae bacterium]|nr:amidohydrolase [Oscillospiraceae bacterium]